MSELCLHDVGRSGDQRIQRFTQIITQYITDKLSSKIESVSLELSSLGGVISSDKHVSTLSATNSTE